MKYLLSLLLSFTIMTAQDTSLRPMKRLVSGGNSSVTLGQVVAGYSNNFHIGIRPPRRGELVSVQEEIEQMKDNIYPNPTTNGFVNIHTDGIKFIQVCNILGTVVYESHNYGRVNEVNTFELYTRGIYFVKMTSFNEVNHSTILIFQ